MESSESVHPETLEDKAPVVVTNLVMEVQDVLATYGWYILGAIIIGTYLWSTYIEPVVRKWRQKRDEMKYAAQYRKNPEILISRQEALEAARQRMQEEHDRNALIYAEKARQREEMKRDEWLARQPGSSNAGQTLRGSEKRILTTGTKKGSSTRPEYNPLMGSGGSGGYRPPKRGCPGGGCGKK